MTKKKQEQKQSQSYNNSTSYGWQTPPESADVAALRGFKFQADPSIGNAFGSAKNQIANSFNNPIGGLYSGNMRDSILRSSLSDLSQKEAMARGEANSALQGQRFGQAATVASMTAPRLVTTGSSGSGTGQSTAVQSGGLLESLIGGAATGAAA